MIFAGVDFVEGLNCLTTFFQPRDTSKKHECDNQNDALPSQFGHRNFPLTGRCDVMRAKNHCDAERKRRSIRRVNYWQTRFAILAMLSTPIAVAEDFKTISGKEYTNTTISRVEPVSFLSYESKRPMA
jgi:hypothetical protein